MRALNLALTAGVLILSGCADPKFEPVRDTVTEEQNYALTMSIDTPAGTRTSTRHVRTVLVTDPAPDWCAWTCLDRVNFTGSAEAPAIVLPDGRTLVMTFTATPKDFGSNDWLRHNSAIAQELRDAEYKPSRVTPRNASEDLDGDGYADVPASIALPYIVAFGDPRDPSSIAKVDPLDLEATLGKGYRLRKIAIVPLNRADDADEVPITRVLPWLQSFRTQPKGDPNGARKFPDDLYRDSFVRASAEAQWPPAWAP